MFWKKRELVAKNAKSVKSPDPLWEFKRPRRGEIGRYEVRGEVWKKVRLLLWLAAALAAFWFLRECWLAWDIFQ